MSKQKLFIILIVIFSLITAVGLSAWFLLNQKSRQIIQNSNSSSSASVVENKDNENSSLIVKVDNVEFSYNPDTAELSYKGSIKGPNGCSRIASHKLERTEEDKIELQVDLAANQNGVMCTQALVDLPLEGMQKFDLSQIQLDTFEQIFLIKVGKSDKKILSETPFQEDNQHGVVELEECGLRVRFKKDLQIRRRQSSADSMPDFQSGGLDIALKNKNILTGGININCSTQNFDSKTWNSEDLKNFIPSPAQNIPYFTEMSKKVLENNRIYYQKKTEENFYNQGKAAYEIYLLNHQNFGYSMLIHDSQNLDVQIQIQSIPS